MLQLVLGAAAFLCAPTAPAVGLEASAFYTVTPCRIADTRATSPPASGSPRTFVVAGNCDVPSTARAVTVNITTVGATGAGYVVLWESGAAVPNTSNVQCIAGRARAGNGVVALASGTLDALAEIEQRGSVDLVIDVTGYFQ